MKKGFTLVELLAVIVILAVILIIAVPQITETIKTSRLKTIEGSAKLIAKNADEYYLSQQTLNPDYNVGSIPCSDVAKLTEDYEDCEIMYSNGIATITLKGVDGGKFDKIKCEGTKNDMVCEESTEPEWYINAARRIMNSCKGSCLSSNGNDGTPNADGLFQDRYGDYRYQGSDPNNYVTFNGTEIWRIVGLFDIDGEKRVKLVKGASLGSYSWDTNVSIGINEWSQAKLQQELNGEYLDLTLTANTKWYNGSGNKKTATFYYIRRLNADSQALIAPATWYLGGVPGSGVVMPLHTTYVAERGSQHPNTTDGVTRTDEWEGLVGLIYTSDFGYASANTSCAADMTVANACTDNWMNSYGWTISPSNTSGTSGKTASSGKLNNNGVNGVNPVRPAVYLVSDVLMGPKDINDTTNALGSSGNPYIFLNNE